MITYKAPYKWYHTRLVFESLSNINDNYQVGMYSFTEEAILRLKPLNGYMVILQVPLAWPSEYIDGEMSTVSVGMPYIAFDNDEDAVQFKLTYL